MDEATATRSPYQNVKLFSLQWFYLYSMSRKPFFHCFNGNPFWHMCFFQAIREYNPNNSFSCNLQKVQGKLNLKGALGHLHESIKRGARFFPFQPVFVKSPANRFDTMRSSTKKDKEAKAFVHSKWIQTGSRSMRKREQQFTSRKLVPLWWETGKLTNVQESISSKI